MHQHCRSDIALQVQQTEPDGGPPAAIQNAQGDSLQHLDIVTACAGSKTASNANIETRFPHNARAVDPGAFLTTLMTAKIRHYSAWLARREMPAYCLRDDWRPTHRHRQVPQQPLP